MLPGTGTRPRRAVAGPQFDAYGIRLDDPALDNLRYRCPVNGRVYNRSPRTLRETAERLRRLTQDHDDPANHLHDSYNGPLCRENTTGFARRAYALLTTNVPPGVLYDSRAQRLLRDTPAHRARVASQTSLFPLQWRCDHDADVTVYGYRRERVDAPWLFEEARRITISGDDPMMELAQRLAQVAQDRARHHNVPARSTMCCAIDYAAQHFGTRNIVLDGQFLVNMTQALYDLLTQYGIDDLDVDSVFRTQTYLYDPERFGSGGRSGRKTEKELLAARNGVFEIRTSGSTDHRCALYCIAMHQALRRRAVAADESIAAECSRQIEAWRKSMKRPVKGKKQSTEGTIYAEVDRLTDLLSGIDFTKGVDHVALQEIARRLDQPIVVLDGEMVSDGRYLRPRVGSMHRLVEFQSELDPLYVEQCRADGIKPHATADWCVMLRFKDHVHLLAADKVAAFLGSEELCWECRHVHKSDREHVCGDEAEEHDHKGCSTDRPLVMTTKRDPDVAKKRVKKIVVYDFESDTTTHPKREHIPNMVCYMLVNIETDEEGATTSVTYGDIHTIAWETGKDPVDDRYHVVDKFVTLLTEEEEFMGAHVYAHNAARYDSKFILHSLQRGGLTPKYLFTGAGLMQIRVQKNNLVFKDSLRLIPQPLASFPKAFGLDSGAKGDFPHLFNTIDNMDLPVDMPMPDISYWEPHMKSPEARKKLEKWYKERSAEGPWDNYKELETYCKQDVRILAQGLVAFRQGVIDVTGFDPLCFLTQASCAIQTSVHKYLPEDCKLDVELSEKAFSQEQHAWMCQIKEELGCQVEENVALPMFQPERETVLAAAGAPLCGTCDRHLTLAKSSTETNPGRLYWANPCCGEHRRNWVRWYTSTQVESEWIEGDKRPGTKELRAAHKEVGMPKSYNVDGYHRESNTIYEWDGCYYHGCPRCPAGQANPNHEQMQDNTAKRHELFRQNGYALKVGRSCLDGPSLTKEHRDSYIHPREAFFGGRVDAFRTVTELADLPPGSKIRYLDMVSLYPTCTAFDDMPHKKPTHYTGAILAREFGRREDESLKTFIKRILTSREFFGILKVDLTMEDRHISTLPEKKEGRLHFDSEDKKHAAYCSNDLLFALLHDQVRSIDKVYGALRYDSYTGPDRLYVCQWLRVKWANSGTKSKEQCDAFNSECAKQGLFIDPEHPELGLNVQPVHCKKNPAMRQIAKIFLNALWGKRGEAEHNEECKTCYTAAEVFDTVFHPQTLKVEVGLEGVNADNVPFVELKVWKSSPFKKPMKFANAAACAFTTANARIRLHKMLVRLHWTQVCYCDTDSCVYWVDPANPEHWDPERVPDPEVPIGNGLGEWEDEMAIDADDKKAGVVSREIVGVVVLGPKSYCLRVLTQYDDGRYDWYSMHRTEKGDVTLIGKVSEHVKAKGITLNSANCQSIHYASMRAIAVGERKDLRAHMMQFEQKGHGGPISTNPDASRVLRKNLHKRFEGPPGCGDPYILHPPKRARLMWEEHDARS